MNKASFSSLLASCFVMMMTAACSSSVTTGSGGTGGGSGGGGNGGAGGGVCAAFADEPGKATVTFHFRNQTPQPIFIQGNCGATPQYDLDQVGAGEDATDWSFENSCLQTCADLQTDGLISCDACAPSVIRLDPGESLDVVWNGTGLRWGFMMPPQCFASPGQTECGRIVAALPGTWAPSARAFSACSGDTCTCQPDGTCWGTPSGMQASSDPVTFFYPSETSVDVVWNSCAFGCP